MPEMVWHLVIEDPAGRVPAWMPRATTYTDEYEAACHKAMVECMGGQANLFCAKLEWHAA